MRILLLFGFYLQTFLANISLNLRSLVAAEIFWVKSLPVVREIAISTSFSLNCVFKLFFRKQNITVLEKKKS